MDILSDNLQWMMFNMFIAGLALVAGSLFSSARSLSLKLVTFLIWLLFIPNTIYLLTDLQYLPGQLTKVQLSFKILLLLQYLLLAVLGIITFRVGMKSIEKFLGKAKLSKNQIFIYLIIINLLISFGVVLGKIYRVHSWYVITNPIAVINGSWQLLNSTEQVTLWVLFALITNLTYFFLKKTLL